ncbi:MAG: T9SS type A sorting domain-containing protein [Ignavibacteriae bacterium]|nr:T9SS type A sorting domain-containing protein [Ignavibacteriota bacterium]
MKHQNNDSAVTSRYVENGNVSFCLSENITSNISQVPHNALPTAYERTEQQAQPVHTRNRICCRELLTEHYKKNAREEWCAMFHFLAFIFLTPFLSFLATSQTNSCRILWDEVKQISFDSCYSIVPQVVAIGDTVHILWLNSYFVQCTDAELGIFYSRSIDGGNTFSTPQQLITGLISSGGQGQLTVSGKYLNVLYSARIDTLYTIIYGIGLLRSTDAGETWERKYVSTEHWAAYSIAALDSFVYIMFGYSMSNPYRLYNGVLMSKDYGATFDTIALGLPFTDFDGRAGVKRLLATKQGLHYVYTLNNPVRNVSISEIGYLRSTDLGYTWLQPETLSTIDYNHSQQPRIDGNSNGNLCVAWQDHKYGGEFYGTIFITSSNNDGISWSEEQAISQYGTASATDIAFENNIVAVTWTNEQILDTIFQSRMNFSTDGGLTWNGYMDIVSDTSSYPSISLSQGKVHVKWYKFPDIFYMKGNFSPSCYPPPEKYALLQNYPNPFNNGTTIEYDVPNSNTTMSLIIYNILGQEITRLLDNTIQEYGHYQVRWDVPQGGISSGVYFYRLITPTFTETRKLILMR